jgi:hypothetical protein
MWGGWMPDIEEEGPIIFFDIEPGLRIPPDVICDLVRLPIRDGIAHAVVADPPYWNFGTSDLFGDPQEAKGSWWGKFGSLKNLWRILIGIVKSSRRVLRPGGRVYLKWCDVVYPWTRFSAMFTGDFTLEDTEERVSANKGWAPSAKRKKPCYWFTYSLKGK